MTRLARGENVKLKLNNLRGNVAKGAIQVDRQTITVPYYIVKCAYRLCGQEFYEFEALQHCPYCLSPVDENNLGQELKAVLILRTMSGEVNVV